ncbi:hypothetical protein BKA70DRAFT_1562329 [Coprinopsis sp. MPI-PUGE-AT-0042]|nr:hypothetical protein BKA70DRAFT_1562329 [Coprinopsis sp. MPI-PUGE-AT-0042]
MQTTNENSAPMNPPGGEQMHKPCLGYRLPVPSHLRPSTSYPWTLWNIEDHPWEARSLADAVALTAQKCEGKFDPDVDASSCCHACSALAQNEAVQGILHRMEHGVEEGSRLEYYGYDDTLKLLQKGNERLVKLGVAKPNPQPQEPSNPEMDAMMSRFSDEEIAMNIMVNQNTLREQDNLLKAFLNLQAADRAVLEAGQRFKQLIQSIAPEGATEQGTLPQEADPDASHLHQSQGSDDNAFDEPPKVDRKGKGKARAPAHTALEEIFQMPGMGMEMSPLTRMMSAGMFGRGMGGQTEQLLQSLGSGIRPGGSAHPHDQHQAGPCKEHSHAVDPMESDRDPDYILRQLGLLKAPKHRATLSPFGNPLAFLDMDQMDRDLDSMIHVQKILDEDLDHRISQATFKRLDGQDPEAGAQPQEMNEAELNELRKLQQKSRALGMGIKQAEAHREARRQHQPMLQGMDTLLAMLGRDQQMQGLNQDFEQMMRSQPSTSGLREVDEGRQLHGMEMEIDSKEA